MCTEAPFDDLHGEQGVRQTVKGVALLLGDLRVHTVEVQSLQDVLKAFDAVVHQAKLEPALSRERMCQSTPQLVGVQRVPRRVLQLSEQVAQRAEHAGGGRRCAVVTGEQIDRVSEVVQMPKYLEELKWINEMNKNE